VTVRWWYPLWMRSFVCRLVGHREVGGVLYEVGRARVGDGCARCLVGTVREYRCQFPMPRVGIGG
jgi:hypothetical protein